MTDKEFARQRELHWIRNVERTRDEYVRIIECLGVHGHVSPGQPRLRNPDAAAAIYTDMLLDAEAQIRRMREEYAAAYL